MTSLTATLRTVMRRLLTMTPKSSERYYATWSGYALPLTPQRPLSLQEAEALPAYCVAVFDADGRVVSFQKWFHDRRVFDRERLIVLRPASGVRVAFYEIEGDDASFGQLREIDVARALHAGRYLRVSFTQGGSNSGELVTRRLSFAHRYEYFPNGVLRRWEYEEENGARAEKTFEEGEPSVGPARA